MDENKIPQGVVAVLVGKDGREIANCCDFHAGSPGGFTQQEAQRLRAKEGLASVVIRELSSPLLGDAIDNYHARQIVDRMCDNGCRLIFIPIGYDADK
jgi:hypothetical protein